MKDDKIAVVEDEAERVRLIYRRYLELGGVNALVRDLRERNIRTKSRLLATSFGQPGLPQSFIVSREVFGMPIRAQHRTGLPRGQI